MSGRLQAPLPSAIVRAHHAWRLVFEASGSCCHMFCASLRVIYHDGDSLSRRGVAFHDSHSSLHGKFWRRKGGRQMSFGQRQSPSTCFCFCKSDNFLAEALNLLKEARKQPLAYAPGWEEGAFTRG